MDTSLGTNLVTWLVILPILAIVAAAIVWFIAKLGGTLTKKVVMIAAGIFTFIGFAVVLLGVYYHLNPAFAGTFKFYVYSTLAPDGNPFQISEGDYGSILMKSEVYTKDGQTKLLSSRRPDLPSYITVFTSGRYINTEIKNDVLTIPSDVPGSEPQVTKTSLWWALTKDIYRLNSATK